MDGGLSHNPDDIYKFLELLDKITIVSLGHDL